MADVTPQPSPDLAALTRRNIEPAFLGETNQFPINVDQVREAKAAGHPLAPLSIALSGGGYRAALFHLGALRRLHEFGVIPEIKTYSSVSGGSILASHLARVHSVNSGLPVTPEEWSKKVEDPFIRFVRTDIRTKPGLVTWAWLFCLAGAVFLLQAALIQAALIYFSLLWAISATVTGLLSIILLALSGAFWKVRGHGAALLAKAYDMLNPGYLRDINKGLRRNKKLCFIFCSTDLVFGVAWRMTSRKIGSYKAGEAKTPESFKISSAVAASSCFPPVFYPAPINLPAGDLKPGYYAYKPEPEREKWAAQISLTDGGVYDNLGIEPLWKSEKYKPNMLVSDGGGPLSVTAETLIIKLVQRYAGIMQNQAISLRKRMVVDKFNDKKMKGTYWGLTSVVDSYRKSAELKYPDKPAPNVRGYSPEFVARAISPIRTDLAYFSPEEVGILMNHGYSVANAAIRVHYPELDPKSAPFNYPFPGLQKEDEIVKYLETSNQLFNAARSKAAKGSVRCYFDRLNSYRQ